MKSLKIGELEAKIPLIQGGMGVGISLSGLAGAVALEGGIGVISTAQIGYKEPDWDRNPIEANLRAIKKEVKKAKEISHGGIIATNIMVATKFYDKYVKAAIDAGVDMIISGAGLPLNLPELARKSKVKLAPIVSSKKAAQIIFRRWERNYNTTPDCVIVEGPNAGGHLGFKPDEIEQYNVCRNDEPENTDKYNKTETNNINVCQKANSVNLEFDNRAKTKLYSDEIKDIIEQDRSELIDTSITHWKGKRLLWFLDYIVTYDKDKDKDILTKIYNKIKIFEDMNYINKDDIINKLKDVALYRSIFSQTLLFDEDTNIYQLLNKYKKLYNECEELEQKYKAALSTEEQEKFIKDKDIKTIKS